MSAPLYTDEDPCKGSNIDQYPAEERQLQSLYKNGPGNGEYIFFINYFIKIDREQEFEDSIKDARIVNWAKAFGVGGKISYDDALIRVTNYYAAANNVDRHNALHRVNKIIQYRESQGKKQGGLDEAHRRVLREWENARDKLNQQP